MVVIAVVMVVVVVVVVAVEDQRDVTGENHGREREKEEARRGSGDGLAWPVWEVVMQELCIYAGTCTEDYSLFYSTKYDDTDNIAIQSALFFVLCAIEEFYYACLLQGIACSGLVHIRSTCLSLLRFPRIFWYITHTKN